MDERKNLRQVDHILLRSVGEKLREHIAASGLTQEEAANKIGTTRTGLLHYLKGDRAMPLDMFINLAIILKVPPAELLYVDGDDAKRLLEEKTAIAEELRRVYGDLQQMINTPQHAKLKERAEELERELAAFSTRLKFLGVDYVDGEGGF